MTGERGSGSSNDDQHDARLDVGLREPLVALPAQVCELEDGVLIVRGASELKLSGKGAIAAVQLIYEALGEQPQPAAQLLERVAEPERARLTGLLEILRRRRFVVGADTRRGGVAPDEQPLDIMYWELGVDRDTVAARLEAVRFSVLGVNRVAQWVIRGLREGAAPSASAAITWVDYPLLRNAGMFDDQGRCAGMSGLDGVELVSAGQWAETAAANDGHCLVAASELGGAHLLRKWNELCVQRGLHFYPVMLDRYRGLLGPLTIPGETPCFECTRARENANLQRPEVERAREFDAGRHAHVVGVHPSMPILVGQLAALELHKFYGRLSPPRIDRLIEVNLLGSEMRSRKVLRIPRCNVCSSLLERPVHSTHRAPGITKEIMAFYREQGT